MIGNLRIGWRYTMGEAEKMAIHGNGATGSHLNTVAEAPAGERPGKQAIALLWGFSLSIVLWAGLFFLIFR